MPLDRLLYRILTDSWGRFVFRAGPGSLDGEPVPDPVGVYVHIPFCRSVCPFCPYNKVLYEPVLAKSYSDCLRAEMKRVVSGLGGARISGIYFGGGTPLTLPDAVESLVGLARPHLAPEAQVAVELA